MQAYKSLFMKWYPDKSNSPAPSPKQEPEPKFKSLSDTYEALFGKKKLKLYGFGFSSRDNDEKDQSGKVGSAKANDRTNPTAYKNHNTDGSVPNFSRSTSTRDNNPSNHNFSRNTSTRDNNPGHQNFSRSTSTRDGSTPSLSRSASTRDGTPIKFSYSAIRRKPPPMERPLACTLEDLLHGCVKKIMLTRDVLAETGLMVEEQELLRIKVKPGWKKGTKITFEGIGDERPGMLPADVIFSIVEEEHPLFRRDGNDLIFELGISLVEALTGCSISVPLLDGGKMNCWIEDIIYPGYEKSIPGQGMPIPHESGKRGELRIKFHVEFPAQLSEDQRSDLFRILEDAS